MSEKYLEYKNKYLKYKNKYFKLKTLSQNKQLTGGSTTYLNDTNLNIIEDKLKELKDQDIDTLLVVLYADWCQFCHNFLHSDSYKNLIETYSKNDEVEIVALNCDVKLENKDEQLEHNKNQERIFNTYLKNYEIMGFPTILKINTDKLNINEFSGDRESIEALKTFIGSD